MRCVINQFGVLRAGLEIWGKVEYVGRGKIDRHKYKLELTDIWGKLTILLLSTSSLASAQT